MQKNRAPTGSCRTLFLLSIKGRMLRSVSQPYRKPPASHCNAVSGNNPESSGPKPRIYKSRYAGSPGAILFCNITLFFRKTVQDFRKFFYFFSDGLVFARFFSTKRSNAKNAAPRIAAPTADAATVKPHDERKSVGMEYFAA